MKSYDVIVIGGGHAGVEAALASARIGAKTALVTPNKNNIAMAPCNPSIGGPAKGIVVREIDALGGIMGKASDASMLQIKILNRSKGPAVHSLRAQIDIEKYPENVINKIEKQENLEVIEEFVVDLVCKDNTIIGIKTDDNEYNCKKVVITTGTYMDAKLIKGDERISSGPKNTKTSKDLSMCLTNLGIELFKLKTGTPPRVQKSSLDYTNLELASGDDEQLAFSFYEPAYLKKEDQEDCHLIYTNEETHKIIKDNIHLSAMYSGVIKGVGPRYCPSIEDKLVRFEDKKRHQLFLEPEVKNGDSIYVQGLSTSLPDDVQLKMLKTLPGFKNVKVIKYGYAIEYDAINPKQLSSTLELRNTSGLYSAGQINGTSGYEEAAGQGIIAGINAALSVLNKEPLVLSRLNSYIGLMIDDLITKGTNEPYRLLTSRSEFRLYLRSDNADQRLSELGYQKGSLKKIDYDKYLCKIENIKKIYEVITNLKVTSKVLTKEIANQIGTTPLTRGFSAVELLKRSDISILDLKSIYEELQLFEDIDLKQVDIEIKYAGYIDKVKRQISRQEKLFKVKIHDDIIYDEINNLALEAREKLKNIRPQTLGIAGNISGINPADISVLEIYLKNRSKKEKDE